jgi:rhodanese-related sulfurtransferase
MKRAVFLLLTAILLLLSGCSSGGQVMDGDVTVYGYTQISQEQAREMMAQDDGHVIVDVRRQDEYDAGHIRGAILIPNESIGTEKPEELPDLDQIILIYCRSGNRSKQAAQKLGDMGYTNIYEFGGINTWTGEIVTDEAPESSSQDSAAGEKTEKMVVRITVGERSITAELNDNDAAKALWDQLPLTLPMMNLYGREMCYRMGKGALPDKDAADAGYEIGDISYWPPAGSLVILYKQNGEVFEQVKIGHTDDDVSFFDGMEDTDIIFERVEQK